MLIEKEETQSTNDDAHALAQAGAASGTAVLALRQARGRGRAGRTFASPEGGLYLSVVLRPRLEPAQWSLLPLASGLAVVEELRARGFDAGLKWPNDVMLAGRKLGGILVESRWGREPFAVVGIGLNLTEAPVEEATALARHGAVPERRTLAEALVARLVALVDAWARDGPADVLKGVRAACVTLGREVAWEKGEGVAVDVAEDGALVVRVAGGHERVLAGDVRLRVR